MTPVEQAHRKSRIINVVVFLVGVAIFASGGFDAKFIGAGVMVYGAIVQAVDGIGIEILSAQDSLEQRLARIEVRLSASN